jgi:hypothetical protein
MSVFNKHLKSSGLVLLVSYMSYYMKDCTTFSYWFRREEQKHGKQGEFALELACTFFPYFK